MSASLILQVERMLTHSCIDSACFSKLGFAAALREEGYLRRVYLALLDEVVNYLKVVNHKYLLVWRDVQLTHNVFYDISWQA